MFKRVCVYGVYMGERKSLRMCAFAYVPSIFLSFSLLVRVFFSFSFRLLLLSNPFEFAFFENVYFMINKRALTRSTIPMSFPTQRLCMHTRETFLRILSNARMERHVLYFDTIAVNHRNRINICLTTRALMRCMWILFRSLSHSRTQAEFINLKCFTCARWEDTKSLLSNTPHKRLFLGDFFLFKKKKGFVHKIFPYTHMLELCERLKAALPCKSNVFVPLKN